MKRRGPTKCFLLLVERCLLEEQKKKQMNLSRLLYTSQGERRPLNLIRGIETACLVYNPSLIDYVNGGNDIPKNGKETIRKKRYLLSLVLFIRKSLKEKR